MNDLIEIARGFINSTKSKLGLANTKVEEKAVERYAICLTCDTISENKHRCDKAKGGCGCPLKMRTRSNKGCPKDKW